MGKPAFQKAANTFRSCTLALRVTGCQYPGQLLNSSLSKREMLAHGFMKKGILNRMRL
jgi:hypothetical protein